MAELMLVRPRRGPAGLPIDRRSQPSGRPRARSLRSLRRTVRTPAGTSRVRGIPAAGRREPPPLGSVTGTRSGTWLRREGPRLTRATASLPPTSRVARTSGGRWGRFRVDSARRSSSATTKTYPRGNPPGCSDKASPRSSHSWAHRTETLRTTISQGEDR